jgi:hypothetical protein
MANWDYPCEPAVSELRAPTLIDENPTRHQRRKQTKRWCRGKVGVEHTLEIRLKRAVASRAQQPHKYGRDYYEQLDGYHCGWSWWLWRIYDDWRYSCGHEWYCTRPACGKIFPLEPAECPEYQRHPKPMISPQEAEDNYQQRRLAERQQRAAARAIQRQQRTAQRHRKRAHR